MTDGPLFRGRSARLVSGPAEDTQSVGRSDRYVSSRAAGQRGSGQAPSPAFAETRTAARRYRSVERDALVPVRDADVEPERLDLRREGHLGLGIAVDQEDRLGLAGPAGVGAGIRAGIRARRRG